MIFEKRGPAITPMDIAAVEQELGFVFPEDYKNFLLLHNGAWSKKCLLKGSDTEHEIKQWMCVTDSTKLPIYSIVRANLNTLEDVPTFKDYCLIAETLCNTDVIMKMDHPNKFSIGLWYPYGSTTDTPDKVPLPYSSFTEFVSRLSHLAEKQPCSLKEEN